MTEQNPLKSGFGAKTTAREVKANIGRRTRYETEEAMNTNEVRSNDAASDASGKVDMKLEVEIIPVSDVDRSKLFYERLGWRFDDDVSPLDGLRIVQFTPPGSGCSVTFGKGITAATPGSAEGGLVVSDIEAAHNELVARGIDASECGTARRSRPRHGNPARTPSAPATGRSSPSMILTAIPG